MIINVQRIAVLFLLFSGSVNAQLEDYNYKRDLSSPSNLWHNIELPNAIFNKVSKDLSDIRIYGISKGNDTIEAPYILKVARGESEIKTISFKIINESKTNEGYYYTFQLDSKVAINQIAPHFVTQNFDWNVTLEASHNQNQWFTILEDYRIVAIKNRFTDYSYSKLNFPNAKYTFFRLFVPSIKNPQLSSVHIKERKMSSGDFNTYPIKNLKTQEDKLNKTTVINLELDNPVPVNYIKLNILEKNEYYRAFDIEYLVDSLKTEKGWLFKYSRFYHGTLSAIDTTEFKFSRIITNTLRLKIYNADNAPLSIKDIEVKGYKHSLITRFNKQADYVLAYGSSSVYKPNYDIVRFTKNIPKDLETLKVGEEEAILKTPIEKITPLFENKYWLWGVMVIIMLILGGFTLKMMRSK